MDTLVSIIIPNRNGSATIGKCLEAAYACGYAHFEVIVVDDCSEDESVSLIGKFPCRLIELPHHSGASRARNVGAEKSRGDILFFIDADCLLLEGVVSRAVEAISLHGPQTVVGGTYTEIPYDHDFFSTFQSVFIHYSEMKNGMDPDYIATHALVISAAAFKQSGGFPEEFMPILEDVEFSHRVRRNGFKLLMDPGILVRHIFHFSFLKSMQNAVRKARYWTLYSIKNRDILADSGTASIELKSTVFFYAVCVSLVFLSLVWQFKIIGLLPVALVGNVIVSRGLIRAFYQAKGWAFAGIASLYYMFVYPLAVGCGGLWGIIDFWSGKSR